MINKMFLFISLFSLTLNCSETTEPLLPKNEAAIEITDNPDKRPSDSAQNNIEIEIKLSDEQANKQKLVDITLITPYQKVTKWCMFKSHWIYGTNILRVPIKCEKEALVKVIKVSLRKEFSENIAVELRQYKHTVFGCGYHPCTQKTINFTNPINRVIKVELSFANAADLDSDLKQNSEIRDIIPYLPTDEKIEKSDFVKIEVMYFGSRKIETGFCKPHYPKFNSKFKIFVPKKCNIVDLILYLKWRFSREELFLGDFVFQIFKFDIRYHVFEICKNEGIIDFTNESNRIIQVKLFNE